LNTSRTCFRWFARKICHGLANGTIESIFESFTLPWLPRIC
jgi:hypothetical protein